MAKTENNINKTTPAKTKDSSHAFGFLPVDVMSLEWFARNWRSIFAIFLAFFFYITCRYNVRTKMESVTNHQKQYETIRSEEIRYRMQYYSSICEFSMKEKIDSLHLDLTVQQQPPFSIYK